MSWDAINPYDAGTYVEDCDYCGCKFKVQVQEQKGHNESEEYWCPECHKEYRIKACNTPRVTLISSRTDGRTDRYKN